MLKRISIADLPDARRATRVRVVAETLERALRDRFEKAGFVVVAKDSIAPWAATKGAALQVDERAAAWSRTVTVTRGWSWRMAFDLSPKDRAISGLSLRVDTESPLTVALLVVSMILGGGLGLVADATILHLSKAADASALLLCFCGGGLVIGMPIFAVFWLCTRLLVRLDAKPLTNTEAKSVLAEVAAMLEKDATAPDTTGS